MRAVYTSLQEARAVAAILVVLFHLGGAIADAKYFGLSVFSVPFSFGSAGVEFFFVLSGFIVFLRIEKSVAEYLRRKFLLSPVQSNGALTPV